MTEEQARDLATTCTDELEAAAAVLDNRNEQADIETEILNRHARLDILYSQVHTEAAMLALAYDRSNADFTQRARVARLEAADAAANCLHHAKQVGE